MMSFEGPPSGAGTSPMTPNQAKALTQSMALPRTSQTQGGRAPPTTPQEGLLRTSSVMDFRQVYSEAGDPRRRPWMADEKVNKCLRCSIEFGWFTRKHHCRECGNIFCDTCSQYRARASGYTESERVCHQCWTNIKARNGTSKSNSEQGAHPNPDHGHNGASSSHGYGGLPQERPQSSVIPGHVLPAQKYQGLSLGAISSEPDPVVQTLDL
jgi:hypothetical protein